MKYELKKSNINKPLGLFEHMFSDQGQLILKGDFLSEYDLEEAMFPSDSDKKYHEMTFDLENESLPWYEIKSEGRDESVDKNYINFLRDYIKKEYKRSIELFVERIEKCNLSDQYFVLYTLKRKIKKFKDYVEVSKSIPHRKKQLQWIEKIENGIISKYEEHTGYLSEIRIEVKDIRKIVAKLIAELKLSEDLGDLDKIVYFICSNNMKEFFGFINYGCTIWTLKEIILSFQKCGFLQFTDTDIVNTKFFRKKGNALKLDSWQNSKSVSEEYRLDITVKIKKAFKLKY